MKKIKDWRIRRYEIRQLAALRANNLWAEKGVMINRKILKELRQEAKRDLTL